ncbi:MAG: glycosyltransferase family 4 protein [Candidatus Hadarchaeum sp.]
MKPEVRVLHLVSGIAIGHHSGGAESFATRLALLLDRTIIKPAVFAMWKYNSPAEQKWENILLSQGIYLRGFIESSAFFPKDISRVFWKLWQEVSRFKPHIVHSHSERGDLLNILIKLFHPLHPCAVRTVHVERLWLTHPSIGRVISCFFPILFDANIAVSRTIYNSLIHQTPTHSKREKVYLCYNGIDINLFSNPMPTDPLSTPRALHDPQIGIIGRLTEQKGHIYLLEALRIIHDQIKAHLLIIGSGPLENTLRQQCTKLNINEYVHFLGYCENIPEILPQLDCLVVPSLWEGFPTVILEAMAMGVPVIATEVSGSKELIIDNETGILVPPKDSYALAMAILRILSHRKQTAYMVKEAKKRVSNYTIQNAAYFYSNLYQKLCGKKHDTSRN